MPPRQFGFDDSTGERLRESEVPAVRGAASRRLAGSNKADVAKWMNAEGYRGTRGAEWTSMTVGRLLRTPMIAGLAEDPEGNLTETGKSSIITPEEFRQLRELDKKESAGAPAAEDAYEYAYTGGLTTCGLCAHAMTGAPSNAGSPGYRCSSGCGKVRIGAAVLEDYVDEYLIAELLRPGTKAALKAARTQLAAETEKVRARIEELRHAGSQLAEDYLANVITRATLLEVERQAKTETKELRTRLRFLEQATEAPEIDDVDKLITWWEHAPARSKRGIASLLLTAIEVNSASAQGIRTIEPGRVVLRWRGEKQQPSTAS